MSVVSRSWRWRFGALVVVAVLGGARAPLDAFEGASWFMPGGRYDQNFPDPHVLFHDGVYHAYATNTGGPLLPSMTSTDLEHWFAHDAWTPNPWNDDVFFNDALVRAPQWAHSAGGAEVWAPFVMELDGVWLAYFAIRESPGRYCVSVASGASPQGPFEDRSVAPITCGHGPAGAIDPWVHVDEDGHPWLVWKTEPYSRADHEATGPMPAAIWSHRLTPDGHQLEDADDDPETELEPNLLLAAGAEWEAGIIESPAIAELGEQLILLYSGNRWDSHEYATGWARCSSIQGPCDRGASAPLLSANADWNGPGGASVFVNGWGESMLAFHAWNPPFVSYPDFPACDADGDGRCIDGGQRFLHLEVLCWLTDGRPHVGVPDDVPFCDVRPDSWETDPITWLAGAGYTTGVSPAHFAPDRAVRRSEAVTFLWRIAGAPAASTSPPFVDIAPDAFFVDAVAWAYETGVIRGTSPTTFSPDDLLTRGQMAVVLHRSAGEPPAEESAPFTDVAAEAWFAPAVDWLAGVGITTGTTPDTYSPFDPVTRAQLAAFLCRYSDIDVAEAAPVDAVDSRCSA